MRYFIIAHPSIRHFKIQRSYSNKIEIMFKPLLIIDPELGYPSPADLDDVRYI